MTALVWLRYLSRAEQARLRTIFAAMTEMAQCAEPSQRSPQTRAQAGNRAQRDSTRAVDKSAVFSGKVSNAALLRSPLPTFVMGRPQQRWRRQPIRVPAARTHFLQRPANLAGSVCRGQRARL